MKKAEGIIPLYEPRNFSLASVNFSFALFFNMLRNKRKIKKSFKKSFLAIIGFFDFI